MKCRKDIIGQKIWVDNNNAYNTRPMEIGIVLYRNGEVYKTLTLPTTDNDYDAYKFPCLIRSYVYRVDEADIPDGYTKRIEGNNIINTLSEITINVNIVWDDNFNSEGYRPTSVNVRLLQNGLEIDSMQVVTPGDESTVSFSFGIRPFVDALGVPYVYTITEDSIDDYDITVDGLNIINTLVPIVPFSFKKTNAYTGASLKDASFDLMQSGIVKATALSDDNGKVDFGGLKTGLFNLQESQPPAGFMDDVTVYDVEVKKDRTITVDGQPAKDFTITNQPEKYELKLERATDIISAYKEAPNSWSLHGTTGSNLFMRDRIIITSEGGINTVKWDYGVRDIGYFKAGGGYDVSSDYINGVSVSTNGNYTVYALFQNGYERVSTINIENMRDGSVESPYLLLDFDTAENLDKTIPGIGSFTLDFMQNDIAKLAVNFEIYEDINMESRPWTPLGIAENEDFTGSLYGNGNDILNIYVYFSEDAPLYSGFFSKISNGARIENLGLKNCMILNANIAGGFAGFAGAGEGKTTVLKGLSFNGRLTAAKSAGIAGHCLAESGLIQIEDCNVDSDIFGDSCGGIVGSFLINSDDGQLVISKCNTSNQIFGSGRGENSYIGGILGSGVSSGKGRLSIENCCNRMVLREANDIGGIAGVVTSESGITIRSCACLGTLRGSVRLGGIAAALSSTSAEEPTVIENCYFYGSVLDGGNSHYAGGIIGTSEGYVSVKKCFNIGNVTTFVGTPKNCGGIAGAYGVVEECAAICATCSCSESVARISPSVAPASETALVNNAAFNEMQVLINGAQKSPLDIGGTDGSDVTKSEILTRNFYENTLGWDFVNIWDFGNSEHPLPVLRGIDYGIQAFELPPHLR